MPARNRPEIIANFALTVDGKISTRSGTPSLFTSPHDKARLQEIRAGADAILAGRGTVAADSMSMGLSRQDLRYQRVASGRSPAPLRVIFSNRGEFDPGWKVFQNRQSPLIIFSTTRMSPSMRQVLAPLCDLYLFSSATVPVSEALRTLYTDYGIRRLVCEGGAMLFRSLAEADLVDEIYATLAPVIFGGRNAPTMTGLPGPFFTSPSAFRVVSHQSVGDECFLHFRRRRGARG